MRFECTRPRLARLASLVLPVALVALIAFAGALLGLAARTAHAQDAPVNGMRPSESRLRAIVGATVIPEPGVRLDGATIVIRDGLVEAVGVGVAAPAGAAIVEGKGLTIYPGLIDAAVLVPTVEANLAAQRGGHWNARVHPQVAISDGPAPDEKLLASLRAIGFTAAAFYPERGLFRGSGAVLPLTDQSTPATAYVTTGAMALALEYGGEPAGYPTSLIGSIALFRQTLLDARWHRDSLEVYRLHPLGNEPPRRSPALAALLPLIEAQQPVLFEVDDEHRFLNAAALMNEFGLRGAIVGSGREFRRASEIASTGIPIIAPLRFPALPDVSDPRRADAIALSELSDWEQAPAGPRRLLEAGATLALTSHRLADRSSFWPAMERAIWQGLTEDAALAALTTAPARLLGVERVMGTIAPGKAANLLVVEGPLFISRPRIRAVWVDGRPIDVKPSRGFAIVGDAVLSLEGFAPRRMLLDPEESRVLLARAATDAAPSPRATVTAQRPSFTRDRISFSVPGELLGLESPNDGPVRFAGLLVDGRIRGEAVLLDNRRLPFTIEPTDGPGLEAPPRPAPDAPVSGVVVVPSGEYGFVERPTQRDALVINATIWTMGPQGTIERGWLDQRGGRIVAVGAGDAPEAGPNQLVIDATGKHLTPGLIDCHSHTGLRGGVNEFGQTNSAEVRIADSIDPDDINFYRQLAGGLTACNQLHGSANPIGGQNSVVKLRWGEPASAYPIEGAMPGIKFALGENVVRDRNRYPNTRMGVEAFLRDAFNAARSYRQELTAYEALSPDERQRRMPVRRDLELETLVEILDGRRLVHCHSYRQDEILMLLRLAEEFGFQIGTLQHVLEGYKVAELVAAHGAGASSFSDWWAYKIEVMDATPYNGALLHRAGVLVSFNSDSSELARRMNTEASKAMRYGGLTAEEALAFVTINPAKQLRIDGRTGSLEAGKDADFVLWSAHPLSAYARCEETWVDGVRRFDLESDRLERERIASERTRLIERVLDANAAARRLAREERRRREEDEPVSAAPPSGTPTTPESTGGPPRPPSLLMRLHAARIEAMLERVRLGLDPLDVQPSDCGMGEAP